MLSTVKGRWKGGGQPAADQPELVVTVLPRVLPGPETVPPRNEVRQPHPQQFAHDAPSEPSTAEKRLPLYEGTVQRIGDATTPSEVTAAPVQLPVHPVRAAPDQLEEPVRRGSIDTLKHVLKGPREITAHKTSSKSISCSLCPRY